MPLTRSTKLIHSATSLRLKSLYQVLTVFRISLFRLHFSKPWRTLTLQFHLWLISRIKWMICMFLINFFKKEFASSSDNYFIPASILPLNSWNRTLIIPLLISLSMLLFCLFPIKIDFHFVMSSTLPLLTTLDATWSKQLKLESSSLLSSPSSSLGSIVSLFGTSGDVWREILKEPVKRGCRILPWYTWSPLHLLLKSLSATTIWWCSKSLLNILSSRSIRTSSQPELGWPRPSISTWGGSSTTSSTLLLWLVSSLGSSAFYLSSFSSLH